eukprot:scaffold2393_cov267-Pinguiococcus_pyrenoidosus.AAC.8
MGIPNPLTELQRTIEDLGGVQTLAIIFLVLLVLFPLLEYLIKRGASASQAGFVAEEPGLANSSLGVAYDLFLLISRERRSTRSNERASAAGCQLPSEEGAMRAHLKRKTRYRTLDPQTRTQKHTQAPGQGRRRALRRQNAQKSVSFDSASAPRLARVNKLLAAPFSSLT